MAAFAGLSDILQRHIRRIRKFATIAALQAHSMNSALRSGAS